jgi:hypothetical protein
MTKKRETDSIQGQLRQGDVLLEEIDAATVQETARKAPSERGVVVAEGEMTGHAHLVAPETAYEFTGTVKSDGTAARFLQVTTDSELRHEGINEPGDHDTITLKKATYKVTTQLEFDPAGMPIPIKD